MLAVMADRELRLEKRAESRRICAYCRNLAGVLVYVCPACEVCLHQECLRALCRDRKGRCPSLACEVGLAAFEAPRRGPLAAAIAEEERGRRVGRRRARRRLREREPREPEGLGWRAARRIAALGLLAGLVTGAPALILAAMMGAKGGFALSFVVFLGLHVLLNALAFRLMGSARSSVEGSGRGSVERLGPSALGAAAGLVYALGLLPPSSSRALLVSAVLLAAAGALAAAAYLRYLLDGFRGYGGRRGGRRLPEASSAAPSMSAEEVAAAIAISPQSEAPPSEGPE